MLILIPDETTSYPETTEPYYMDNTAWNDSSTVNTESTEWMTTVDMTTSAPIDPYIYLHQTMEHKLCQNPENTTCGMCSKYVGVKTGWLFVITCLVIDELCIGSFHML